MTIQKILISLSQLWLLILTVSILKRQKLTCYCVILTCDGVDGGHIGGCIDDHAPAVVLLADHYDDHHNDDHHHDDADHCPGDTAGVRVVGVVVVVAVVGIGVRVVAVGGCRHR